VQLGQHRRNTPDQAESRLLLQPALAHLVFLRSTQQTRGTPSTGHCRSRGRFAPRPPTPNNTKTGKLPRTKNTFSFSGPPAQQQLYVPEHVSRIRKNRGLEIEQVTA
jgi:hypothetical protein